MTGWPFKSICHFGTRRVALRERKNLRRSCLTGLLRALSIQPGGRESRNNQGEASW